MTVDIGPVTAATITLIWGVLWSFAMEYLWFFKDWVDKLDPRKKQSVNALGIFIVVAVIYTLSFFDVVNGFSPDLEGLLAAFIAFFLSLGVGQGVHLGTKKVREVAPRGRANPD